MKQITSSGRIKDIRTTPYLVDWHADQGSEFSSEVLDFLFPFWKKDVILSEWPVAGTRMRYDYVNLSKKIIIETDGEQHSQYSPYFHNNSRAKYLAQIKRDVLKDKIAELNGFKMVRINPSDLPITKEFFKRQFDITL